MSCPVMNWENLLFCETEKCLLMKHECERAKILKNEEMSWKRKNAVMILRAERADNKVTDQNMFQYESQSRSQKHISQLEFSCSLFSVCCFMFSCSMIHHHYRKTLLIQSPGPETGVHLHSKQLWLSLSGPIKDQRPDWDQRRSDRRTETDWPDPGETGPGLKTKTEEQQ